MNEDLTVKEERDVIKIEENYSDSNLLNITDVSIVSVAYLEACLDYVSSLYIFFSPKPVI